MSKKEEPPKETKVAAEKVRPVYTIPADLPAAYRLDFIASVNCHNCGKPTFPYLDNEQLILATCVCPELDV
jgi:hypothetical protein